MMGKDGGKGEGRAMQEATRKAMQKVMEKVAKGGSTSTGEVARLTATSRRHCEPKSDYTLLGAVGRQKQRGDAPTLGTSPRCV